MYKIPKGYNVHKSVYALDADLLLSQGQTQKDGLATGQVAAPAPEPAVVSMQELHVPKNQAPAATPAEANPSPAALGDKVVPATPGPVSSSRAKSTPPSRVPSNSSGFGTGSFFEVPPDMWTPGRVRYVVRSVIGQNWAHYGPFVECEGYK